MPALPQSLLDSAIDTESERSDNALSSSIKSMVAPVMQRVQSIQLPDLGSLLGSGGQQVSSPDASGAGLGSVAAVPVAPDGQPPSPTAGAQSSSGFSLPSLQSLLGGGQPSTSQNSTTAGASASSIGTLPSGDMSSTTQSASAPTRSTQNSSPMPAGQPPTATGQTAAPLGPIKQGDPQGFFETAGPYARQVEQETGVPAALSLAIAANETGYGQTRYMAGPNNYHGIQAQPGEPGAVPYKDWRPGAGGQQQFYDAAQRSFASPLDGFRGFANFLTANPRYAPALARYQQTHDVEQLAADVKNAGYAEDPAYVQKITSIMRGIPVSTGVGEVTDTRGVPLSAPQSPPAAMPEQATRQGAAVGRPTQFAEGLSYGEAIAACGLAGVAWFMAKAGRTPQTVAEVKQAATVSKQWDAGAGMHGIEATASLLRDTYNIPTHVEDGVDFNKVRADVLNGNPVLFDTNAGSAGHYYTVNNARQRADGQWEYDLDTSATDLKASKGRQWYTENEIEGLGFGRPFKAIYMDNPLTPAPSVVAGASASTASSGAPIPSTTTPDQTASPDRMSAASTPPTSTDLMLRLPLGASPTLNDASSSAGGVSDASAPPGSAYPSSGAGGFQDDYTNGGQTPPIEKPGTLVPIQNPDGSVSTELSITVTEPGLNGGRPTNIPTVWGGRRVSDNEAVDNAIRSGVTFQSFNSIKQAEQAARRRSQDLGSGRATSVGGASVPDEIINPGQRNRAVPGTVDEQTMYRQPLGMATPGADTNDYTQNGQVSPWSDSSLSDATASVSPSTSAMDTGTLSTDVATNRTSSAIPSTQVIPNEDPAAYPIPDYRAPASPLVTAPEQPPAVVPPSPTATPFNQGPQLGMQSALTSANATGDGLNTAIGTVRNGLANAVGPMAGTPTTQGASFGPASNPLKPVWDAAGAIIGYVRDEAQAAGNQISANMDQNRRNVEQANAATGYGQVTSTPGEPDYVNTASSPWDVNRPISIPARAPSQPYTPEQVSPEEAAQRASVAGLQPGEHLITPISPQGAVPSTRDDGSADIGQITPIAVETARQAAASALEDFASAGRSAQAGDPLQVAWHAAVGALNAVNLPFAVAQETANAIMPVAHTPMGTIGLGDVVMTAQMAHDAAALIKAGVVLTPKIWADLRSSKTVGAILQGAAGAIDRGIAAVGSNAERTAALDAERAGQPAARELAGALSGDVIPPERSLVARPAAATGLLIPPGEDPQAVANGLHHQVEALQRLLDDTPAGAPERASIASRLEQARGDLIDTLDNSIDGRIDDARQAVKDADAVYGQGNRRGVSYEDVVGPAQEELDLLLQERQQYPPRPAPGPRKTAAEYNRYPGEVVQDATGAPQRETGGALPSRPGPAFNAAIGAAPVRGAVGAGVGAATGGVAGYNAAPEDATPAERAGYTAVGGVGGALAGATIAGAGTLAAGRLIDSLVESGRLNPRVLATHPQTADRIRALFSLAAEGLPDDATVAAPAMVDAMVRMRPQLANQVSELLNGPVTAGQVRQIVGDAGSPSVVQTVQEMAVDALTGLGSRARRGREMAADAATVRGLADEAAQVTRGRLASSDPTFPTRDGLGRLVDQERQPNLTGFVNEVADNLGVERPSIYVTDSPHVNASATTKDGGGNAIIINRGLLNAGLTDDEMAAVLTHELAHTAQDSRSPVARAFGAVRDAVGNAMGSGARDLQGALPGGGNPPQQPPANLPAPVQNWYQRQAAKNAAEIAVKGIQPLDPVRWVRNLGSTVGYSSMIGPGTFSVSLASNALEPLYAIPKEITRGGVRAIQTGRMEALREPMTMASGAMTGLGHVGQALWDVIRAKGAYAANPDMAPLSERTADPAAKLLAQVLEVPGRVWSGVPDAIFGTVAEHAGRAREAAQIVTDHGLSGQQWSQAVSTLLSQAQQAKTGALTNAPALVQQVVKAGEDYGTRLSYRDPLGTIGKQVKTATSLGNIPVFSNLVAPFFNTPWNIMLRQGERSPVGLAMNTQKGFDKYYDAIVGSALVLGLGSAAQAGRVTGSGPSDQGQRKLLEADGWKPYSTLVNGVYVPNRVFGIGETLLNAAGDAHDFTVYRKPTDDARTLQTDALARIGSLVSQQPFAAGYSSIADLANFGPESFAADQAVRMTPFASTARMVGTAMDTKERRPDTGGRVPLLQDVAGRYAAGVGNRAGLPVAQDVFGQEKPNLQQGAWALLPRMSPVKDEPAAQLFLDARTGLGQPPDKVSVGRGVQVPLTPDEQRQWNTMRGQIVRENTDAFTSSPEFMSLTPPQKQVYLSRFTDKADQAATKTVLSTIPPDELQRRIDKALALMNQPQTP